MNILKVEAMRRKYDKKFEKDIAKYFNVLGIAIGKIKANQNAELGVKIESIVQEQTGRLRSLFLNNWVNIVTEFGKYSYESFANGKTFSIFSFGIYSYIATQVGAKISGINANTRKIISAIIKTSVTEGLSIPNIVKILKVTVKDMAKNRARRIARTEVSAASNYGSWQGAKQSGAGLKKFWISTKDKRTRKTHRKADGQTVGMDEKFRVGKAWLKYPGDSNGSAAEVVNCRCVLGYKRVER
jgi:SPP1 gp7 family putative phage head morphogenesis protein